MDSFFGDVDEAARVDDDDLRRRLGSLTRAIAGRSSATPSMTSRIDAVLRAAEADEMNGAGRHGGRRYRAKALSPAI